MSLRKDTIYNALGNGLPLLAAAVAIPYLLERLGHEQFGILTLIWVLVGYFSIFDFGVGRALTYQVSLHISSNKSDEVKDIVSTGLILTAGTGALAFLLVYFIVAPNSPSWLGVKEQNSELVKSVFQITAIGIIPTTLNSGARGALEGYQRFYESNINRFILGTLMFLVPWAIVLIEGPNLDSAALGLIILRYTVCGIALFQLRNSVRWKILPSLARIKSLLNYSVWITISGVISPLMVYGDRFIVSAIAGAQSLPLYAIPQEGLHRLLLIPAALTAALFPRMTSINDKAALRLIYVKNINRIAVVMAIVLIITASITPHIIKLWISEDFSADTISIVIILCIGLWFNSMAQMSMTLLHAIGRPKLAAISHIIELPLYIGAVVVLTHTFGISGAAIAWSMRVVLDFFLFEYFARSSMK